MVQKSLLFDSPAAAHARLAQLISGHDGVIAVMPAAGIGQRAALSLPKQYAPLAGRTVLAHSVSALLRFPKVCAVLVVLSPDDTHWVACDMDRALGFSDRVVAIKAGGATRRDSVLNGLQLLRESGVAGNRWVMVHDAARPGLTIEALERLWHYAQEQPDSLTGGAILALPVADTMKRDQGQTARVAQTLDRRGLWAAQTPQMFALQPLIDAYESAPQATDEASAMESAGATVALVQGDQCNFKLTQPEDFFMMEALMRASPTAAPPFAVGQGFDVHALVAGRPLIMGGVTIPFEKGLAGHSDADVLLHAITDAILGASGLGDIGRHFPDTDAAYKGADSVKLLQTAMAKVHEKGWRVAQIDATIIAQAPKIAPYAAQMQQVIGRACEIAPESVNIKGKTTEGLGFTGRGEGIAAQAVAMLVRHSG